MPSAQVIDLSPTPQAPTTFEKTLSAFSNRHRENTENKKEADIIGNIYKKYQNDENMIDKALGELQTNPDLSPSRRVEATKHLLNLKQTNSSLKKEQESRDKDAADRKIKTDAEAAKQVKEQAEIQRRQNSVYELYKGVLPEEEARKRSQFDSEATARSVIAQKTKAEKPPALSEFDKTVQRKAGENYIKAKDEIPKLESNLENLDRIDELAKNFKGITGFVKGASGFSEQATELDNIGLASIDQVLKIFNPVGAIPIAKINLIKDKFAAKATEPYAKTTGKTKALRRYATQALERAKDKVDLYEKYQGNIPKDIEAQFDKNSKKLAEQMANYDVDTGEEAPIDLPDADSSNKGKIATNPETGQRYKSDGISWRKV